MKTPATLAECKPPPQTILAAGMPHAAVQPLADQAGAAVGAPTSAAPAHDFSRVRSQATACPLSPGRCPFGGACHACPPSLQAKPIVAGPRDQYEQEADRAADGVGRGQGVRLQRRAAGPVAPATVPPIVHEVLRSPGKPLDAATRASMEPRFGYDFGQVRVHADPRAAESAHAVNALAYTVGQDVVFAKGQYTPRTRTGRRLLAHELTHVVQQSGHGARVLPCSEMGGVSNRYEREAQSVSRHVVAGNRAHVRQKAGVALQRAWDWGGAGLGALVGGVAGGLLGLLGGPLGALIGLGAGTLLGGLFGGLLGGREPEQLTRARRQCSRLLDRIRQHPVYRSLVGRARTLANDIMAVAQQRDNCLYYAGKLQLLLDTPEAPRAVGGQPIPQGSNLERNRQRVDQAVRLERARLATPEAQREVGRQEQIANDPARRWTQRRGRNDTIFYVDSSDPNNIVVCIKVRLLAGGSVTTPQDIANEVFLEDAIERVAETRGYTVDVIFVDQDGPDVFTFSIDFDEWPTSANPVGNARTLAHEIHHLMGLPDRYDYIEVHAANPNVDVPTRLRLFRRQMDLQPDPSSNISLMGRGRTMLNDDVCRVAGLDLRTCMAARARGAAQVR